jgi:integrase
MAVYVQRKNIKGSGEIREDWYADFQWRDPSTGKQRRIRRPLKDDKQRPVTSRTAAERAETRLRDQLARGEDIDGKAPMPDTVPDSGPLTMAGFWPRYTTEHVARNKPSSRDAIETIWRVSLAPVVGAVLVAEVGSRHYAKIAARMRADERAPKTINNALSALLTSLTIAHEWKLRAMPEKVRWEKVPEVEIEWFDDAAIDRIVGVGHAMATVAIKTGLRLGELRALRWGDVDMRTRQVTVSRSIWEKKGESFEGATKSNRIRVVPLPESAVDALKGIKPPKADPNALVFPGSNGGIMTKNESKWPLWRVCKAAGLELCRWHKLRHSYVSALVRKGVPLPQVQKLAGHARIEMTMRYTHVAQDDLRRAVSVLA